MRLAEYPVPECLWPLTHDSRYEYLALFGSLILVLLETIIHLITFCLRVLCSMLLSLKVLLLTYN